MPGWPGASVARRPPCCTAARTEELAWGGGWRWPNVAAHHDCITRSQLSSHPPLAVFYLWGCWTIPHRRRRPVSQASRCPGPGWLTSVERPRRRSSEREWPATAVLEPYSDQARSRKDSERDGRGERAVNSCMSSVPQANRSDPGLMGVLSRSEEVLLNGLAVVLW